MKNFDMQYIQKKKKRLTAKVIEYLFKILALVNRRKISSMFFPETV